MKRDTIDAASTTNMQQQSKAARATSLHSITTWTQIGAPVFAGNPCVLKPNQHATNGESHFQNIPINTTHTREKSSNINMWEVQPC
jgi:hypothetical protein